MPAGPQVLNLADAVAVKLWKSKALRAVTWGSFFFDPRYGFVGSDQSRLCVETNEFKKAGGNITCTLLGQMSGDGFVDGAPMEGATASYPEFDFIFEVHELVSENFGVKSQYTEQLVAWDVAENGVLFVKEWWLVPLNSGPLMQLCGSTFTDAVPFYQPNDRLIRNGVGDQYTMMNPVTVIEEPVAGVGGRIVRPSLETGAAADHTTDEAVAADSTAIFNLALVDILLATAIQAKPPMRICRWAGGEAYIFMIHTDMLHDLIDDTKYDGIQNAILQGGMAYEESSFATGNVLPYRGTIFPTSNWNPPGQNSSTAVGLADTRRAPHCAAGSLAVGWGAGQGRNRFDVQQGKENYGRRFWANAGAVWGGERVRYNSKSYANFVTTVFAKNRGDA